MPWVVDCEEQCPFKYTYLGDTGQQVRAQLSGTPIRRTYAYETNQGDRCLTGITHTTGARAYTWDAENRLIGIGYKTQPQHRTEMRYDGESRRVAIIEINGATRKETRYTWCEDRICQARDENDQPIAYFFDEGEFWPTPGVPISPLMVGEKNLYAKDHLGSIRDTLDKTGNIAARFDYDPYGGWLTQPETLPQFGYAGMFYHAASGLYLTHYRAYDPKTARWLSRDPIEEKGGINLYGYVGGKPISYVDPLGLDYMCHAAGLPAWCPPPPPPPPPSKEEQECLDCQMSYVMECAGYFGEGGVPWSVGFVICQMSPSMTRWKEVCTAEGKCKSCP